MKTGRPPLPDKVRVTLSLDRQTVDAARSLGNGSVSRGIRDAFVSLNQRDCVKCELQGINDPRCTQMTHTCGKPN